MKVLDAQFVTSAVDAAGIPKDGVPHVQPPVELPASGFDLEAFLESIERRLLQEALARAGGVQTEAAKLLGLSFRSIRYRIAKLRVGPPGG